MRNRPLFAIATLVVAMVWNPARAAFFCATSNATIASALTTAATNGQDDLVRITAGTYAPSVPFEFTSEEAFAIEISGGWGPGCTTPRVGTTTIDGQHLFRALRVSQNSNATGASVTISDLTLLAGKAIGSGESGGGLYVFNRVAALIERLQLLGNHTQNFGGGVYLSTSGPVEFRDNLIVANSADDNGGGAFISTFDPTINVTNNTVFANSATLASKAGGIDIFGGNPTTSWLSNNIVWNNTANGAADVVIFGANVRFYNDLGTVIAQPADPVSQGNVSIDPQFRPCSGIVCFEFHLARSSPLVDAGFNSAAGGIGSYDADGKKRLIGTRVDIGAFELDTIFENGFD